MSRSNKFQMPVLKTDHQTGCRRFILKTCSVTVLLKTKRAYTGATLTAKQKCHDEGPHMQLQETSLYFPHIYHFTGDQHKSIKLYRNRQVIL